MSRIFCRRAAKYLKRNGAQGRIRTTDTRIFSLTNRLDIAYLFVSLGQTWDIVRLPVVDDRRGRRAQQRRLESRGDRKEHTSELQSLMRTSYAVFGLKKT